MDDRERGSFISLPDELLLIVIEHCDTQDVAALSGVAKQYSNICRPIIFRNADLSIHNRGKVLCVFPNSYQSLPSTWYEPSDSLQCNNIPPNMQKRQEAFLSALIRNPSLAEYVQTFSWTLLLLDSNRRTILKIDPFAINKSVALDPKSPFNEIWKVFASLTRVQTLDLAWLSRHLAMPLIHSIPSTLFPAATSVRLVGVMPYALAASILLTNPQNLLHLHLDNLQQSGIIPSTHIDKDPEMDDPEVDDPDTDGSDMDDEPYDTHYKDMSLFEMFHLVMTGSLDEADETDEDLPEVPTKKVRRIKTRPADPISTPISIPIPIPVLIPTHRQTRQPWNNLDSFGNESEYFDAPGPMQNLLGALAGKCPSLTSLYLCKVGARDQFDFTPACSSKEHDIYAEWAIFLASVKPTLQSLTFEQGERLLPRADWVQPPVRPMDALFGARIFPVLARAGRWPGMKKVVVRGVQMWEEDDGQGTGEVALVNGRGELRSAFGYGVEVVTKRRAREADHLGMGYS